MKAARVLGVHAFPEDLGELRPLAERKLQD